MALYSHKRRAQKAPTEHFLHKTALFSVLSLNQLYVFYAFKSLIAPVILALSGLGA